MAMNNMINTCPPQNSANPAQNAAPVGDNGAPLLRGESVLNQLQIHQQSNAYLLSKLNSLVASSNDTDLAKVLNDKKVIDKLEMGILHYQLCQDQNLDNLDQAISQLSLKFVDQYPITQSMKDLVLKPYAESCLLDAAAAFNILDSYFKDNYNKFHYFEQLNQRITQLQAQLQQSLLNNNMPQQPQAMAMNQFQRQEKERTHQEYDKELRKVAVKIVSAAKEFYMNERRSLLRILVVLIGVLTRQETPGQPRMNQSQNLIREKLIRKNLPINLAKGLLRCQDRKEFQRYCEGEGSGPKSLQDLALALQGEKIEHLKLLFVIFYSEQEVSKNEQLVGMMIEYLQRSCQIDHLTEHFLASEPLYAANQSTIEGLTQLTCLAMLQLHKNFKEDNQQQRHEVVISKQKRHAWNLLLNKDNLSQTTGAVVLCVVAQAWQQDDNNEQNVKEMVNKIKQNSSLLVAITEIINSEVFRSDELQQMVQAFYLVLYGWLKIAYCFFKQIHMEQEVDHIQVMTLRVLGYQSIIRLIWSEAAANSRNIQNRTIKDISNQIEIFKSFLEQPNINLNKFLEVILCLTGNKREPRAADVMEMLSNTKIDSDSDLLTELIAYLIYQLTPLERHQLEQDEFKMVEDVLILFAKAIKQDPIMYIKLNKAYKNFNVLSQEGKLANIFQAQRGQTWFESDSDSFLQQLIIALHSLMAVSFEYSRTAVSHLMDAITELYNNDQLVMKMQIVETLSSFINHELGGARIVSYFGGIVLEAEKQLCNFKATESYLRFLTKVFKQPYPQKFLPYEQKIEFERSLFASSLEKIYLPCMDDYFNTNFIDAASMGKFTSRLLKLTRALLCHFMEIPQSQKAPLCEPFPRFDLMLEFLSRVLNTLQIDHICIQTLELVQVETTKPDGMLQSRLENKILSRAIQNRQGDSHQVSKLILMVKESIRLLNFLLELAMVDDQASNKKESTVQQRMSINVDQQQNFQDLTSKRCEYIKNLRCVQEFSSQVLNPTQQAKSLGQSNNFMTSQVSISLQSIVAHYILPTNRLGAHLLKARALDHLTLTCKLWQRNLIDSLRPDLYQLLQGLGSSNQIEHLFGQSFESCLSGSTNQSLEQCMAWFDLLIIAAESQPKFLEMLLKEDGDRSRKQQVESIYRQVINLLESQNIKLNLLQEQQKLHTKYKVTALLSTMAKKRLCIEFIQFQNHRILACLWTHVIENECLKQKFLETQNLNGQHLQPLVELEEEFSGKRIQTNSVIRNVTNQCLAKVTICLYIQLIVCEYSRDPTQPHIRKLITKVFTNDQLNMISVTQGQISPEVHNLLNVVKNLSDILKNNNYEDDRNRERQKYNQDRILARGVDLREQNASPLHSADAQYGAVYIKDSLCIDLFRSLEKRQLTSFIVNPGAELIQINDSACSQGQLGCKLYVSTKEFEYAMNSEFYENPYFLAQAISCSVEYNLALSIMLSDYFVLRQKQNFIVSIGKISLRDSQMSSQAENLMPLSFLPLISQDISAQSLHINKEMFAKNSCQLTKILIQQANSYLSELLQRKRTFENHSASMQESGNQLHMPQNYFLSKIDQTLLSNLVFTLGIISSQLSASKQKLQIDIKSEIQKLVQQDILLRMKSLIDIDSCLQDPSMIAQEVADFIDLGSMVSSASATTAMQQNQKNKYEIFMQLVTQCFQLCIKLKDSESSSFGGFKEERKSRGPMSRGQLLDKQRIEDAYVKVLAQVLNGMQRNFCFLDGLKVFVLGVQLIDNSRDSFMSLMKKQNNQTIKIIIGRLLEKDVTHEEITNILQLLINYAINEQNAQHLSQLKILETLFKSNIMQRINEQDLYFSKQLKNQQGRASMQQIRNPSHVHWCQVLVLIRTMNDSLLQTTQIEQSQFFRDMVQQMHHFKQRIPKVLHVGLQMEAHANHQLDQLANRSIMSLALLEEIELICAVMQQVFEHSDHWAQLDPATYQEFKDYTLFSVTKLLEHCSQIIPGSVTEHHLAKVTQNVLHQNASSNMQKQATSQNNLLLGNLAAADFEGQNKPSQMNAFELKVEITLQKTFLSVICSLLNILLLSKQLVKQGTFSKTPGSTDLLQTWHNMTPSHQQFNSTQQPQFQNYHNMSANGANYRSPNQSQSGIHQAPYQLNNNSGNTSGVFTDGWLSQLQLSGQSIVGIAFQFVLTCQQSMKARYTKLRSLFNSDEIQELYKYMQVSFQHDEWILQEYSGGFNSYQVAEVNGLADVMDMAETSLQVSGQVSAMLLEKVREGTSNDLRFANAAHQFSGASLYQTEEQQVMIMADELINFLGDVAKKCRDDPASQDAVCSDDLLNQSSDDQQNADAEKRLDKQYLDKLHEFVKVIKSEPGLGAASNNYYNQYSASPWERQNY